MSRCRSCPAEIRWAVTAQGNRIPLDVEAVSDGNLALLADTEPPIALVIAPGEQLLADDGTRYVSHFATCPNADQHRRSA